MTVTEIPSPALDAEELLHLAIIDSQAERHDAAIAKLKTAAEQAPKNGKIHYMLAAEHAQIGLFDRAIDGMKRALAIDATLVTARLQLGLLFFTQGRVAEARTAWAELDKLGKNDPLFLFKSALLDLDAGDAAAALPQLERAAENVRNNPALLQDIQRVLNNVRQKAAAGPVAPKASHLLATKYGDSGNDER